MIDEKNMHMLENIGAKDSKLLSPKKREDMFGLLVKAAKSYEVIEIPPAEIDEAVESENTNLNWLEAQKAAIMLNKLNPDIAIVDCPSPNLKAYKDFVYTFLKKKDMELIMEHKAERHLPVAAASIIAKKLIEGEFQGKVNRISVNEKTGKAEVDFNPGIISEKQIAETIKEMGYGVK